MLLVLVVILVALLSISAAFTATALLVLNNCFPLTASVEFSFNSPSAIPVSFLFPKLTPSSFIVIVVPVPLLEMLVIPVKSLLREYSTTPLSFAAAVILLSPLNVNPLERVVVFPVASPSAL